jgi:hypothetical protein
MACCCVHTTRKPPDQENPKNNWLASGGCRANNEKPDQRIRAETLLLAKPENFCPGSQGLEHSERPSGLQQRRI